MTRPHRQCNRSTSRAGQDPPLQGLPNLLRTHAFSLRRRCRRSRRMRCRMRSIRSGSSKSANFTPHPPLTRSPFPPGGRLRTSAGLPNLLRPPWLPWTGELSAQPTERSIRLQICKHSQPSRRRPLSVIACSDDTSPKGRGKCLLQPSKSAPHQRPPCAKGAVTASP